MKALLAIFLGVLAAGCAQARPVVVEMFTSQACSSCPPADALLRQLKTSDPGILPLSFNVTYWNGPAWTDPYSLKAATERQGWYVGLRHSDTVYTPEAVVDGGAQMVGSDRGKLTAAIAQAKAAAADVPVTISGGQTVILSIGKADTGQPANIWLFGYDSAHTTQIGGGENGGAKLIEINVVRSITPLGTWMGIAETYNIGKPAGEHLAVVLQRDDGVIEGAAAQ